ncbi:hypothetical protein ES692_17740 [Psychroserpens burtonensis]|uniref:DUF6705 domain-containing protein n=1 Tax=Psychroserpens burtonensis TaxID=49278 RepID=A0A5C7B1Y5_9FLAO|nr:DUF6705 family protein [Psychroserpens burtonensis]TXE14888.1 hypothetical protein ES692_17740 [Psychroserpens burtonensis]
MRQNYISLLLFTIILSSCKAQNVPLYRADSDLPEWTHYKDLDSDLNDFEGIWKWQSNDSIVIIEFQKIEDVYEEEYNQYEDYLVGEYKFTVGGTVVQNYLSRLDDNTIIGMEHYIASNTILHKGQYPKCADCTYDQRQVFVYFTDLQREYLNSAMVLRYKVEDGVEKRYVVFYSFENSFLPSIDSPNQNRIPYGDYTFIKQ